MELRAVSSSPLAMGRRKRTRRAMRGPFQGPVGEDTSPPPHEVGALPQKESSKPEVEEFGSISLLPARTRIMDPDSVGLAKHQDWSFITHTFVFYCSALLSLGLSLSRTYKHTKTPF
uniref:Uncharacterized protein n=1 Tax=Oryza glumipatula TaxID=40148 RepID=A0A0D9Z6T3_9ORYZ